MWSDHFFSKKGNYVNTKSCVNCSDFDRNCSGTDSAKYYKKHPYWWNLVD